MADFVALTDPPINPPLFASEAGFGIRQLTDGERIAIEDRFFALNERIAVSPDRTAVIIPCDVIPGIEPEEAAVLLEFALGVLSLSGFTSIGIVAKFNGASCTEVLKRAPRVTASPTRFPARLRGKAAVQWLRQCFGARNKLKRFHVTADRLVRFLRATDPPDSLVDLCISLESLLDTNTEVSFRFAACLSKVCGLKSAAEISDLLSDLYDLRSKVVHGGDPSKAHKKIAPSVDSLRRVARAILSTYVLFIANHSMDEWKRHLKKSLFV